MSSVCCSFDFTLRSENPNVCQQRVDLLTLNIKWKLPDPLQRIEAGKN